MTASQPFVSVIVPTRNRPDALGRCLESLVAQRYPGERREVLVVNDGGAPLPAGARGTIDALRHATIIDIPHGGPAAARNAGVARARGEVLAFIDDDCFADPGWVGAMVERLRSTPGAAVGGRVINALAGNRYARASQLLVGFLYRYYHEEGRGRLPFFTTNNLAVRAETFAHVGPFDASYPFASEDRDWSDRCLLAGHALVYVAEAVVHHAHPLALASFLRQHFRYGEGARHFHRSRARRRGTPIGFERAAFYRGMLAAPYTARDPEATRVALLLATSQAVAAVGWAVAALRPRTSRGSGRDGPRVDVVASPGGGAGRDGPDA